MDAWVAAATREPGWVPTVVAGKIIAQLEEQDPELLAGWLRERAHDMLRDHIAGASRSRNARARKKAKGKRFFLAAQAFTEDGDYGPISLYTAEHVVDFDNSRKRACDMTGAEHKFVADFVYREPGNRLLMLAAFHDAIADRLRPDQPMSEVVTESDYVLMYRSIVGADA